MAVVELLGIKRGQTRLYRDDGTAVAVSVVEVSPNRVVQVKNAEHEGYNAVQVTFGQQKSQRLSKSLKMHYAKHKVQPGRMLREFRVEKLPEGVVPGAELGLDRFADVAKVDVIGISKGRGFAGAIKRWNFSRQDETHGNSLSHRAPGSIGQCQFPGRVFKGKKMAGQMGNAQVTQMSLKVERCDVENNLLLVAGSVPGRVGGVVRIRPACKAVASA